MSDIPGPQSMRCDVCSDAMGHWLCSYSPLGLLLGIVVKKEIRRFDLRDLSNKRMLI